MWSVGSSPVVWCWCSKCFGFWRFQIWDFRLGCSSHGALVYSSHVQTGCLLACPSWPVASINNWFCNGNRFCGAPDLGGAREHGDPSWLLGNHFPPCCAASPSQRYPQGLPRNPTAILHDCRWKPGGMRTQGALLLRSQGRQACPTKPPSRKLCLTLPPSRQGPHQTSPSLLRRAAMPGGPCLLLSAG